MIRLLTALLLAASPAVAQEKLTIAAVNAPLASFAQSLGGDAVDVLYPVPEGADAAFWRPPIKTISEFQSVDIILLNGADFAKWTTKTSLPRARTVNTSAGFADAYIETTAGVTHSHGNEGEHSHTGLASLTWLDFDQARQQADAVAAAILKKRPDLEDAVSAAQNTLVADLEALSNRATKAGEALANQPVIAMHPGYEYFARAHALNLQSVTWPQGEDPDADMLAALDTLLATHAANLAIWPDAPTDTAKAALTDRGLTSLVMPTGASTQGDFTQTMTEGLEALEAALP